MRMILPFGLTLFIYILTEIIFIYGLKSFFNKKFLKIFLFINISISLLIVLAIGFEYFNIRKNNNFIYYTNMFYCITYFLLFLVTKLIFNVFFIINQIIFFLLQFIKREKISFKLFTNIGIVLSIITFITITYGIIYGKNDLIVKQVSIFSSKIPQKFNKFKIVQISDLHLGSFYYNTKKIKEVVNAINNLKPDIVILTGDLVNNFAEEANGFDSIFVKIKAKYGKYAVLGNHDFGDYTVWRTPETKQVNLNKIILHYKAMGFNLLQNNSEIISNGNDSIQIAGVDNWGMPPFKKYGDLKKASKKLLPNKFTIMLSHDPTHWEEEIKFQKNIDLTCSGHTHGMQFGFEKFGIKWSPVKYRYKNWAGLYQNKNSYLYVNRGIGCIGFIGRIGMPPEITLIEIIKK